MKAKEYYERYKSSLESSDRQIVQGALKDIFDELRIETLNLFNSRKGGSFDALDGCIREINQKCNAILDMINKNNPTFNVQRGTFEKFIRMLLEDKMKEQGRK